MPGRRNNNEGSITKRTDGRWMARITLEDGKRRTFYGKTRQEVASVLKAAIRDLDSGLPVLGAGQSVAEYLDSWLQATQQTIRPRTWRRREEYIRLHLSPTLGRHPLAKLSPQQVQAFYAEKLEEGLSSTTVRHLHAELHRALKSAFRLGLVQRNVTEMVDPPRMEHREMPTLSREQARTLLAAAAGNRFEALYVLALSTGMRQGELLALKWRDVNLDDGTIQVRASLQHAGAGFIFTEPKTKQSRRLIKLPKIAVEALHRHRLQQALERTKVGDGWVEHDLVFPNSIGAPKDGRNVLNWGFRPLLEKAGLPRIRFHDLRHTAATLLLESGVNPKIVSEMLGHSHISITLSLYSHVTPHMQQLAADAMDAALGE